MFVEVVYTSVKSVPVSKKKMAESTAESYVRSVQQRTASVMA